MTPLRPARRVAVAFAAVACAAVLFRTHVASAVVTRGDDVLRAGDLVGAVRHYDRATRLDPDSPLAADRLAFALLLRRGNGDAARAYAAADRALRATPNDATLLSDRAFAARRLGRWQTAERDFGAAARLARDPRFEHLAAHAAARAHAPARARAHLRSALVLDPAYAPARALLARTAR